MELLLRKQEIFPSKEVLKNVLGEMVYSVFEELETRLTFDEFALTFDWTEIPGLRTYSGGIRYSKQFSVTAGDLQNNAEIRLDLGRVVSSVQVFVNGHDAGTRVAAPCQRVSARRGKHD
ncbi:MAG: hypothetical protein LBS09_02645 [Bacteroidales bacterium]|nr:hypothetical protein [Bacteroidales bacterium]